MRLYPDAVRQFITDPAANLRTETSRSVYSRTLRLLAATYPDHRVQDFTEQELVDFCARPELSPASQAGYRTRVQGFFSWAKWRGIIDHDPASNLGRYVKGSQTKPVRTHHWFTEAEVQDILERIDRSTIAGQRRYVVARLGFTIGLRREEIARLTWKQLDLANQRLQLVGKGGKRAALFVPDRTVEALEKWRLEATHGLGREPKQDPVIPKLGYINDFQGGDQHYEVWWTQHVIPHTIGQIVKAISDEVGVEFTAHDMRRSFAGILVDRGVPLQDVSAALRHANLGTTQRYLEQRQDAGYRAVKGVGFDL